MSTILLIGPPGSGKTTAACSLEHPTALIDVDLKAHEMDNLKPLIQSGDVTIIPINKPLVSDRLSDRALNPDKGIKNQPEGYIYTIDLLSDIVEGKEEYAKYNTIVLDSLTRLAEHLKRLMIYLRSQGKFGKVRESKSGDKEIGKDMNWPSWGSYLANWEELITSAIQMDKNFILTAHQMDETEHDGLTDTDIVLGYWPMVDGQMRKKLAGYFNEVYFMDRLDQRGKEVEFRFRTRGKKYCARTSFENVPEFVPADLASVVKEYARKIN